MEKSHPLSHGNDSGARNTQTYGIVLWIRSIILRQNRQLVPFFREKFCFCKYPIPLLNHFIPPFNFIFPVADDMMRPDQK